MVSVIVPVYNAEPFIEDCLTSIANQTYKDLEIVLVDDGSKDNSGAICDRFSEIDDRFICIHKSNGGLSSARNAGLDAAKGEYIAFVDSDDCIASDMIEVLYGNIIKYKADLSGIEYTEFVDELPIKYERTNEIKIVKKNIQKYIMQKNRLYCVVRYLFSKKVLLDQKFNECVKLGEDQEFIFEYMLKCSSLVMSGYGGYFYRKNLNSLSNGTLKANHRFDLNNRLKFIEKLDKEDTKFGQAHYFKGVIAYWVRAILYGVADDIDYAGQYYKEIRKNLGKIFFSSSIEIKYKIIGLTTIFGEKRSAKLVKKVLNRRW